MNANQRSTAREWTLIATVTALGAVLRFWSFGRLSLGHFDEGIYAFSGLWIAAEGGPLALDPIVIAYAPPGYPLLVGLAYLMFGIADLSAILVATVCGIATIPVVGWLGRRTFGTGAGASAATFAAFAMVHVAFSRRALTDAPFLLAWMVAMGMGMRFLEKPCFVRAVSMGMAVGLAQNIKYNGWLSGAIIAAGATAGILNHGTGRTRGPLLHTLVWGTFAAILAGFMYAPWYGFVSSHGGYAALIRHHRGYVGGVWTWFPNWNAQMAEAYSLAGSRSALLAVWLIAWLSCAFASNGTRLLAVRDRRTMIRAFLGAGLGCVIFAIQPNLSWWVGLGWCTWLLLARRPSPQLVGTWWLVLSILTPFYHPYARLWLPVHAVGWLMLGGMIAVFGPFRRAEAEAGTFDPANEDRIGPHRRSVRCGAALGCLLLSALTLAEAIPVPMPWNRVLNPDPSRSMRAFAFEYLPDVDDLRGKTIRVLARRPLAFYLLEQGQFAFQLEPGISRLLGPARPDTWAIVDEAILLQEGNTSAAFSKLLQFWRPEWPFTIEDDPVTLLDIDPSESIGDRRHEFNLWLLSPRIPPGPPPYQRTGPAFERELP